MNFLSKLKHFHWQICIWKCHLPKWRPSCPGLNVLNHAIRVDPLSLGRCMNMFKKIWFWMTIVANISWALSAKLHWDEGQNSKLTLVQVMTWYRQATSYYLSQCRHSSLLPYGITWPQWVNGTNSVTVQVNVSLVYLTHWSRDKMAAMLQNTFSDAFSWTKLHEFHLKFHLSLFLRVQLTIFHHWFRKWLGDDQATSHYLNQWWLDYRRIYASLGLNELNRYI